MNTYFDFINTQVLDSKINTGLFPFSKYLFWDTPIETIDLQQHKNYIIERVLSRGFLTDFYLLLKLYSNTEITAAIKSSKILDKKTINFCSHFFKINIEELHVASYHS